MKTIDFNITVLILALVLLSGCGKINLGSPVCESGTVESAEFIPAHSMWIAGYYIYGYKGTMQYVPGQYVSLEEEYSVVIKSPHGKFCVDGFAFISADKSE